MPAAQRVLGEWCREGAECKSGVCCEEVCSQCCSGAGCDAGQVCAQASYGWEEDVMLAPWQCAPGEEEGQTEDPCLDAGDCASGQCTGDEELRLCGIFGTRCAVDEDCLLHEIFSDEACLFLGVYDGRCQ